MGSISKFQIVVFGIFIAAIAGGITLFAVYKGGTKDTKYNVVIWGTLEANAVNSYLSVVQEANVDTFTFRYVQYRPETMYQNYVEAIINGNGPDILLLPQDLVWQYRSKIVPIPYNNYSEKEFKSTFIQEGELYLGADGILALPLAIDPLVMYWNRDIFNNALIPTPPKYWEDFLALPGQLTKKDAATNITQSTVALGEFSNITHAKESLSLLMMQAGNPVTIHSNGALYSSLQDDGAPGALSPTISALGFYTQFANPIKQVYSWNRAMPDAKNYFTSNRLAIYFGLASELREINIKNPNLNYDVAVVPQRKPQAGSQIINMTFGRMSGLSIALSSRNRAATMEALRAMTTADMIYGWVEKTTLPSVRRDILAIDSSSAESTVFATSALISRGWLDPNPLKTNTIFKDMIESITSGRRELDGAVQEAHSQMVNVISTQ